MKLLELFAGTHSVGKVAKELGYDVVSLDIDGHSDITCDILDWDYTQYAPGYFSVVWASPECKVFSSLQHTNIGRKYRDARHLEEAREANSVYIKKTIEIIQYLKPDYYFIENPLNSAIWKYVDQAYREKCVVVDYCYFGYRYKKPTKILTNKKLEDRRCACERHDMRLGVGRSAMRVKLGVKLNDNTTLKERYSIPPSLVKYLLETPDPQVHHLPF